MRMRFVSYALACIMAVCLIIDSQKSLAQVELSTDKQAAKVNGTVITRQELDRELAFVLREFMKRGQMINDTQIPALRKNVLEYLINRELLYQAAQKNGNMVNEELINKQFEALKKNFSSEAEFKAALSKKNISEDALKIQIRKGIVIQTFINSKIAAKIRVSDKEMRVYYDEHPEAFIRPEQVRVSHILIKVSPKADKAEKKKARKKIEKIQTRLKNGEDFTMLAKKFSEGPSASNGGDLGYFGHGRMVKPFEKVAFGLKPGEVSDITETRFGYHLIKLIDKKAEKKVRYENAKTKIEPYLKRKKLQKEVNLYIGQLKEKAKITRLSSGSVNN